MKQLLLAALAAAPLLAAAAPAPQPIPDPARLTADVKVLASDAFEGRGPATTGEDKTIAYLIQQMEAAGLEPGGEIKDGKRAWTQDVPLARFEIRGPLRLDLTAGGRADPLAQGQQIAIRAAQTNVDRVAIKDAPLVFVGYGVKAPERGWDDFKGVDLKGKIAVVLINDPDFETGQGDFGGKAMTYYGRWTYKFEEAARQGAAAAIIVHDSFPAAYPWGVVQSSWAGPRLEQDTPGDHMDQSQAIGWMQLDKAKALFASAGKDFDALAAAATKQGFKAVPLGVKASVSWDNAIKRQASKNVVGILPGTGKPDEVVLYSAHWDHLGRCDAVKGDDICNGAVDNASGIGGLVALAEAHAKAGPARRSIVFLAVTAEESGLLGSKFYAENPVYPLARTVGGVNMDSLNVIGKTRDFVLVGAGKSELEDLVKPIVAAEGRVIVPEERPEAGGYYRSDHFSFAKLGVPMLYGESGDDLVNGGKEAGEKAARDYTQNRYHKPQDEYDPSWDWSGAVSDLNVYYGLGRQLADGSAWPSWYPTAEFRAIRDKSRAGQ